MAYMSNQWLKSVERMRGFNPTPVKVRCDDLHDEWDKEHKIAAKVTVSRTSDDGSHHLLLNAAERDGLLISLLANVADDAALIDILSQALGSRAIAKKGKVKGTR